MTEEITVEISPAEPEQWSEPSFSPECLLSAIRERIPHLEACRLKSRYARTDKEARQIRGIEHELHGLKTQLGRWSGFDVRVDESLLYAQCACDMAGNSDYDQRGLERSLEMRVQNHVLRYVQYAAEAVGLFEIALSGIRKGIQAETLFWNPAKIQPVLPDVPPRLISPAKPAVTKTVLIKEPVQQTRDVVQDASLAELEALCADDSRPNIQIRASQRLTAILAAQMNGRSDTRPLFTSVRVGEDTVMLEARDCQTLRSQYVAAAQSIAECQEHDRTIKCLCLASFREWYYDLQRVRPNDALTLATGKLWDDLEIFSKSFERPKPVDPTIAVLAQMIENQNDSEPSWLGRRSDTGAQYQKDLHRKRRDHDYR